MKIYEFINEKHEHKLESILRGRCNGFKLERHPGCGLEVTIYGIGFFDYLKIRKELKKL